MINNVRAFDRINNSHIWLILFITFTTFIFAPLEVYITKTKYVWYSIYDFAPYIVLLFIIFTLILILFDVLFNRVASRNNKFGSVYEWIAMLFFLSLFSLYIQGNFVQFHYGLLDGTHIDWSRYGYQGIVSFITFAGIILAGILIFRKFGHKRANNLSRVMAICVLLVEVVTLIVAGSRVDILDRKITRVALCDNEFTYSKNNNFIIIILDKFDYRLFNDLLAGTDGEYVRETFEDFTYYSDMVSLYQRTDYSFPQIVADSRYLCEEPFTDYLKHAFDDSYLIDRLHELDYSVDIYTTQTLPPEYDRVDNWRKIVYKPVSKTRLLGFIYRFIGFRYMPQFLKEPFWFYPDDINGIKTAQLVDGNGDIVENSAGSVQLYEWFNSDFNDGITKGEFAMQDSQGSFHLYHLKGMHPALKWDRNFEPVDYVVSDKETALSLVDMMSGYFDSLKKMGIYDNATIIVMADHGDGSYKEGDLNHLPLFMYKGKGENHPMKTDDSPHSYAQLNDLYSYILSDGVSDAEKNMQPDLSRYIYDIEWADHNTYADNNVAAFKKVFVDAGSDDLNNYRFMGEEYGVEE